MSVTLRKTTLQPEYFGEVSSLQFRMIDESGDSLVVYRNGYTTLKETEQAIIDFLKDADKPLEDKLHLIQHFRVSLIKFLSPQNATRYLVRNQSIDDAANPQYANCVIVRNGNVYIYPKISSNETTIGINHSSVSRGSNVDFAGTLKKDDEDETMWILTNTSGHYQTRASRMSVCLEAFIKNDIPIQDLYVQHWILIDPRDPFESASYLKITTRAINLLRQMSALSTQRHSGIK